MALAGTTGGGAEVGQTPIDTGDCHVLALPGTAGQNGGVAGAAGLEPVTSAVTGQRSKPIELRPR